MCTKFYFEKRFCVLPERRVLRNDTILISRESPRLHLLMLVLKVSRTSVFRLEQSIAAITERRPQLTRAGCGVAARGLVRHIAAGSDPAELRRDSMRER